MLNDKSAFFMRPHTQMNDLCINGLNGNRELYLEIASLYFNWLYSTGFDSN